MRQSPRNREPLRVPSCPKRQLLQPIGTPCDLGSLTERSRNGDTVEEDEVEGDTDTIYVRGKGRGDPNKKAPKMETLLEGCYKNA